MDVVLVHGAWHGGWCWERVAPLLERSGHRVVAPDLTGCGQRAGDMSSDVVLATHIADIEAVIDSAGDEPVLLVGHSYGGMVISGVAETMAERISGLVYVDAFYPNDGDASLDFIPGEFREAFRQQAAQEGDGWRLPPSDQLLDLWGLQDPEDRRWVRERIADWSLPCFEAPLSLPQRRLEALPRVYVAATSESYPLRPVFAPLEERAEADGCRCVEVPVGHDVMIQAPQQLAEVVLDLTRS